MSVVPNDGGPFLEDFEKQPATPVEVVVEEKPDAPDGDTAAEEAAQEAPEQKVEEAKHKGRKGK